MPITITTTTEMLTLPRLVIRVKTLTANVVGDLYFLSAHSVTFSRVDLSVYALFMLL